MASLREARFLGGIASALLLSTIIPFAGSIVAIIAFLVLLLAVKNIADTLNDRQIFRKMIYAVGTAIVGTLVVNLFLLASILSIISISASTPISGFGIFTPIFLFALFLSWVFFLFSASFLREVYTEVSKRLNVETFRTAGLLFMIGAWLTILVVGIYITLAALILQAAAFLSIPDKVPEESARLGDSDKRLELPTFLSSP